MKRSNIVLIFALSLVLLLTLSAVSSANVTDDAQAPQKVSANNKITKKVATKNVNKIKTSTPNKNTVKTNKNIVKNNKTVKKEATPITAEGYADLVSKVEAAKSATEEVVIELGPGNYDATKTIAWDGTNSHLLTIDGKGQTLDGKQRYQFLTINSGKTVTLKNMTIKNYNTSQRGGAILCNGAINIDYVTFINNTSTSTSAGAIHIQNMIGQKSTINNSIFIENKISKGSGGAITVNMANVLINNTKFINNTGAGSTGNGGAINNIGSLTIENSIFDGNNHTNDGGAIYTDNSINLNNVTFTNNTARSGGAIYYGNNKIQVTNSQFINNTANKKGGALGGGTGILALKESNLTGNYAPEGGAIYTEGKTNITDSQFEENAATTGAAIYAKNCAINLESNTFTNNTADDETLYLPGTTATLTDNQYVETRFQFNEFKLELISDKTEFYPNEEILLLRNLTLQNPEYYDESVLDTIEYQMIINDENKYNLTGKEITIRENYTEENHGIINIKAVIEEYGLETNVITVTIQKPLNTTIETVAPTENTVNKTTPITIIFTDEEGNFVKDAYINVTSNSVNETIYIARGVLVYQFTPRTVGSETITFTYVGNETLNPTESNITITVTPDKDAIIEELTNTANELNNTVQDQANTISTQKETIKEVQQKVEKLDKTVEKQNQDIKKLENEVKKLTDKTKTKLTIGKSTATVGKKVSIKVTVKDANGKAVTGGKVSLKVNGKVLKDSNSNIIYADVSKGVASIKYLVPGSWIKQDPKIQAIYAGNDKYADSTITKTKLVKVNKGSTTITLTPNIKSTKAGSKIKINVKHIDKNTKKGLTSKVAVKVNGKTYKVKVKKGEGVLTYTVPAGMNAKKVKVTASHSSKYYNKAKSKTTFKVTKTTPTIKTTKTTYKSKKTTIKGKILDANSKVLTKNVKVTVKVDGKTVLKNKVVKKGKINLSFKKSLKKGYHELVITSKATKAFNKASFTGVLKV